MHYKGQSGSDKDSNQDAQLHIGAVLLFLLILKSNQSKNSRHLYFPMFSFKLCSFIFIEVAKTGGCGNLEKSSSRAQTFNSG